VNHVCIRAFLDNKERLRQFNSRAKEVRPAHRQQRSENHHLVEGANGNSFEITNRLPWQFNLLFIDTIDRSIFPRAVERGNARRPSLRNRSASHPNIDELDGNKRPSMSVRKGSEEYPMSFALIAMVGLLSLALIFSRIRARKSAKPDFPRLFK
jgi:hypothetical protein